MKTILLKDTNGNLYAYGGYDADAQMHQVLDVEVCDNAYVCTNNTWYMTDEELVTCTLVLVEA